MTVATPLIWSFFDIDGSPLENGYLYFGAENLNPETVPIIVYWDKEFTQAAAQPLRTIGGYIHRNGKPANVFLPSEFSLTVRDKNRKLVYYEPTSQGISGGGGGGTIGGTTVDDLLVNGALTFGPSGTFDGPDGHVFIRHLSEEVMNLILSSNSGGGGGGFGTVASGNGRLSFVTATPIMTTTVNGGTTVFYTGGTVVILNDGAGNFTPFSIGELSQAISDTTRSPAASEANAVYDIFAWKRTLPFLSLTSSGLLATLNCGAPHGLSTGARINVSGSTVGAYNGTHTATVTGANTLTYPIPGAAPAASGPIVVTTAQISRGPKWRNAGQIITGATNATPIVITANGHGLVTGDITPVRGVQGNSAANGNRAVTVIDANTFSLNGSVGNGAYLVNSGQFAARGTGANTSEIELVEGVYVNKFSITNGPAAQQGTLLGTIMMNASNQLEWNLGGDAAGGVAAFLGVDNLSNAVVFRPSVRETTLSWTYNSATITPMNGSNNHRITYVSCLPDGRSLEARIRAAVEVPNAKSGFAALGLNSAARQSDGSSLGAGSTGSNNPITFRIAADYVGLSGFGRNFMQALQGVNNPGANGTPVTYFGRTTLTDGTVVFEQAMSAILTL